MSNSEQINNTSYYQLPCGKFLEDFIFFKGLNFNMGSALKYIWRAGKKDGESKEKDSAKAEHYIRFEAKCQGYCYLDGKEDEKGIAMIRKYVEQLIDEAERWDGQ